MLKKVLYLLVALVLVFSLAACAGQGTEDADATDDTAADDTAADDTTADDSAADDTAASDIVIGFSEYYNGNSYHQSEDNAMEEAFEILKADGYIADYVLAVANEDINQQITAIENMILQQVDGIIINPGSPTALNGAIEKAYNAEIPVLVINDGPVTTEKCYELENDFYAMTKVYGEYVAEQLGGEGNVLMIRGLAGTQADIDLYEGAKDVLDQYPGITVVSEVYGEWTHTVTETAVAQVLPSLPEIDAVIGQGGDAYGAVLAFEAAGRDIPLVCGGNRGIFLNWWAEQYAATGYDTVSICSNPKGIGSAAAYVMYDIITGVEMPRYMVSPNLQIAATDLGDYAGLADDDVAGNAYDWDYVKENIETQEGDGTVYGG